MRLRNFTLQPIDLMATSPIPSRLEPPGLDDSKIYTTSVDSTLFRAALAAHGHALADDILRAADATAALVSPFVLASRFVTITANLAGVWTIYFTGFPQEVVF